MVLVTDIHNDKVAFISFLQSLNLTNFLLFEVNDHRLGIGARIVF